MPRQVASRRPRSSRAQRKCRLRKTAVSCRRSPSSRRCRFRAPSGASSPARRSLTGRCCRRTPAGALADAGEVGQRVIAAEDAAFEHDVVDVDPVIHAHEAPQVREAPGHGVPTNCTRPRAVLPLVCGFSPSSSRTVTETSLLASSRSQALRRPVSSEPSGEFATQTGVWLSVALRGLGDPGGIAVLRRGDGRARTPCTPPRTRSHPPSFSVHVQALARRQACARSLDVALDDALADRCPPSPGRPRPPGRRTSGTAAWPSCGTVLDGEVGRLGIVRTRTLWPCACRPPLDDERHGAVGRVLGVVDDGLQEDRQVRRLLGFRARRVPGRLVDLPWIRMAQSTWSAVEGSVSRSTVGGRRRTARRSASSPCGSGGWRSPAGCLRAGELDVRGRDRRRGGTPSFWNRRPTVC